jgi:ketol-acid reductoisomerase
MVGGFNHNVAYQGVVYHVQSEDGGLRNPVIVTLLYQGGTVLASRKTYYADIIRVDNLAQVVEELMKEQHKEMLRSLKNGEFDETIALYGGSCQAGEKL